MLVSKYGQPNGGKPDTLLMRWKYDGDDKVKLTQYLDSSGHINIHRLCKVEFPVNLNESISRTVEQNELTREESESKNEVESTEMQESNLENPPTFSSELVSLFSQLTLEISPEIQLIEVKGPRDRLSDRQIIWLERLNQAGISSFVCHVHEPKQLQSTKRRKVK